MAINRPKAQQVPVTRAKAQTSGDTVKANLDEIEAARNARISLIREDVRGQMMPICLSAAFDGRALFATETPPDAKEFSSSWFQLHPILCPHPAEALHWSLDACSLYAHRAPDGAKAPAAFLRRGLLC